MRKIAFTIDVEKDFKSESYNNIKYGLANFMKILDKKGIKATLFVTCDCLKKFPGFFRDLKERGHEISLHGYHHERWDVMNKMEKEETLNKAIKCYEEIFGERPIGFRAPQFSADYELIELLNKNGFVYDSSLVQFPLSQAIFFPSRIGLYLGQSFVRYKIRSNKLKIWELMVSSFGLPISAFTLRILPNWIFRLLHELAYVTRKKRRIVFLSHSYELRGEGLKLIKEYLEKNKNEQFVKLSELIVKKTK